jgi:plasmid stabilization system protein ParE
MQIRFVPEAEAELAEARTWYRSQREGLDVALMQRVDDALARILENPKAFPVVQSPLRRAIIRQFPFAIFFEGGECEIVVFAVFHSRRNPRRVATRLK